MSITFGEMMNPTITEDYPDAPPKFQERYRGVHVLQRDENGLEKCVACFLCAAACPADCIYIEAAENTDDAAHQRRRALRQGLQHRLHRAASSAAIAWRLVPPMPSRTATVLRSPATTLSTLIYRKEQMLAPIPKARISR